MTGNHGGRTVNHDTASGHWMETLDKKIFGTLFFSLFATVTGVGIVVPLLPVYAHDLGASGIYIGLIFGAFSISRTCFLPYFGRRSDREGRKPFITIGLLAYAILSVAFAISQTVEALIAIRFIQGIASAMTMPVIQAYVGDITPADREGVVMGTFNMSVFFGLSLGPIIGGAVSDRISMDGAFLCMGALAFIGFLLSLVFLPPVRSERSTQRYRFDGWMPLLRNERIIGLFLFRFAYTACIGIIWGFQPVFADAEMGLSTSAIGVLVALGVLTAGVLQTPMGYLADRVSRRGMAISGGVIVTYAVASFSWAVGFWDLFVANILFGVGGGVAMAPVMAMAVRAGSRTGAMGSVLSLLTVGHSLGMMCGALLAGVTMELVALRPAFAFGSVIMLAGMATFHVLTRPREACDF